MISASVQRDQKRYNVTQNQRSTPVMRGRWPLATNTANCWRKARFSIASSHRLRNAKRSTLASRKTTRIMPCEPLSRPPESVNGYEMDDF
jgi:hypothetical protein